MLNIIGLGRNIRYHRPGAQHQSYAANRTRVLIMHLLTYVSYTMQARWPGSSCSVLLMVGEGTNLPCHLLCTSYCHLSPSPYLFPSLSPLALSRFYLYRHTSPALNHLSFPQPPLLPSTISPALNHLPAGDVVMKDARSRQNQVAR